MFVMRNLKISILCVPKSIKISTVSVGGLEIQHSACHLEMSIFYMSNIEVSISYVYQILQSQDLATPMLFFSHCDSSR